MAELREHNELDPPMTSGSYTSNNPALSDVLRYGDPLIIPGPFLADVLGSLELALEDECPACIRLQADTDRLGVLCGICSVRDRLVERLYEWARDEHFISLQKQRAAHEGRLS